MPRKRIRQGHQGPNPSSRAMEHASQHARFKRPSQTTSQAARSTAPSGAKSTTQAGRTPVRHGTSLGVLTPEQLAAVARNGAPGSGTSTAKAPGQAPKVQPPKSRTAQRPTAYPHTVAGMAVPYGEHTTIKRRK